MFKLILKIIVFLYNVSGGRIGGKMGKMPILLLTTTGRRTGKKRTNPVVYLMDGPAYVVTASAGGADRNPGWFFNLRSNPQAAITVRDKRIKVTAEVAGPEKRAELWTRLVADAPNFAGYQKRTKREIPMLILHPAEY